MGQVSKLKQTTSENEKAILALRDMVKSRDLEIEGLITALQNRNEKYDAMTEELAAVKEQMKSWQRYIDELQKVKDMNLNERIAYFLTNLFKKK